MKHTTKLITFMLLLSSKLWAQQDAVISSYKNQPEIIASHSVTLKPGFTVTAGSNVYIHIASNPGVNIGTKIKPDMNAIITYTPTVGGLVNAADTTIGVNQIRVEVQTFDHLGKLKEIQQVRATPQLNSLAHLKEYDALGRIANDYLPYVESPADSNFQSGGYNSPVKGFYMGLGANYAISPNPEPESSSWFEDQPDAMLREQGAPGLAFGLDSGHTKRYEHIAPPPDIIYYRVKNNKLIIDSAYHYAFSDLTGSRMADENVPVYSGPEYPTYQSSGSAMEFKNFKGEVILRRVDLWKQSDGTFDKRFSTYYVYDDRGNLCYVLPPRVGGDSGNVPLQDVLDNLCYQYQYDNQNRMTAKKIPGRGWDYMIYNHMGQVVMTQDSVQRVKTTPEWSIIKYDAQGRVVLTGICALAGTAATMQHNVDLQGTDWETRTTTGNGYTAQTYPKTWATTLSLNYYDNYDLPGGNPYPYSSATTMVRDLATASKVNVLGTTAMLWTVSYYDDQNRVIKTYKQHYKSGAVNTGNYDEVTNTYDFTGSLLTTTRSHKISNTEALKTLTEYTYDTQGRKIDTWETINTGTPTLIARNDYDELGNLFHKKLHSINNGSSFLQTITYHYNERGWLQEAQADKFDLKLAYNITSHNAHSHYNGNIAEQAYTGTNSGSNFFTYEYDGLNRLVSSNYNNTGIGLSESIGAFGISGYDPNGNIFSFFRNGVNSAYTYAHSGNSNQVAAIGGNNASTFTYDGNGNQLTDSRRGVTLTYNQLNLPATVSGTNTATYQYDASGTKLKSFQKLSATDTTTRLYISGIQYTHGSINFIQTDEGIAVRNPTTGVYAYQYNLKDHLGNTRVTIDTDPTTGTARVIQEDEYYAFGLDAPKFRLGTENKYLYNGKEKQDVLVNELDYGARFYDPVIARWTSVDPLAEKDRRWSPYSYGFDNSLRFTDPDGMWPDPGFLDDAWNSAKSSFKGYFSSIGNTVASLPSKVQSLSHMSAGQLGKEYVSTIIKMHPANILINNAKDVMQGVHGLATGNGKEFGSAIGRQVANTTTAAATDGLMSGAGKAISAASGDVNVYRVFGGDASANGFSWTPENPMKVSNFRDAAGLPSGGESGANNTADFMIKGTVNKSNIIEQRPALPLDGNSGGLKEYLINPANVDIKRITPFKSN